MAVVSVGVSNSAGFGGDGNNNANTTPLPVAAALHSAEFSCLYISTTTWARDSHELFDYEARHVHKKSYFLKRPAKVFRTTLEVQVVPEGHSLPDETADYLLSVRQREGRFIVVPADKSIQGLPGSSTTILPKKLWLIVKELPSGNHQLQEGDVIKLGRFKLRVKQLVKSGPTIPELRLDDVETPHSTVTPQEALSMQCRICLVDGGTDDDPLICPCQCKGSIKFVHLDCLRHWINGRLSLSDDSQQPKMSFFFKQLQCELCKTPFPSAVFLNDERVPIVKVPKIEAPFIILENIVGTANRGLHVISMGSKKELKLGRGHESDVRIADVSISRYHATIRFSEGEFILEDHNSKFGTLVSLRKIQPVEATHSLAVQVGRTVLNLSLRKPPSDFDEVLGVNDDPILSTPDTDQEEDLVPCVPFIDHTIPIQGTTTGGHANNGTNNSHEGGVDEIRSVGDLSSEPSSSILGSALTHSNCQFLPHIPRVTRQLFLTEHEFPASSSGTEPLCTNRINSTVSQNEAHSMSVSTPLNPLISETNNIIFQCVESSDVHQIRQSSRKDDSTLLKIRQLLQRLPLNSSDPSKILVPSSSSSRSSSYITEPSYHFRELRCPSTIANMTPELLLDQESSIIHLEESNDTHPELSRVSTNTVNQDILQQQQIVLSHSDKPFTAFNFDTSLVSTNKLLSSASSSEKQDNNSQIQEHKHPPSMTSRCSLLTDTTQNTVPIQHLRPHTYRSYIYNTTYSKDDSPNMIKADFSKDSNVTLSHSTHFRAHTQKLQDDTIGQDFNIKSSSKNDLHTKTFPIEKSLMYINHSQERAVSLSKEMHPHQLNESDPHKCSSLLPIVESLGFKKIYNNGTDLTTLSYSCPNKQHLFSNAHDQNIHCQCHPVSSLTRSTNYITPPEHDMDSTTHINVQTEKTHRNDLSSYHPMKRLFDSHTSQLTSDTTVTKFGTPVSPLSQTTNLPELIQCGKGDDPMTRLIDQISTDNPTINKKDPPVKETTMHAVDQPSFVPQLKRLLDKDLINKQCYQSYQSPTGISSSSHSSRVLSLSKQNEGSSIYFLSELKEQQSPQTIQPKCIPFNQSLHTTLNTLDDPTSFSHDDANEYKPIVARTTTSHVSLPNDSSILSYHIFPHDTYSKERIDLNSLAAINNTKKKKAENIKVYHPSSIRSTSDPSIFTTPLFHNTESLSETVVGRCVAVHNKAS